MEGDLAEKPDVSVKRTLKGSRSVMNVSRPNEESLEKKILNNYMAIQKHQ